MKNEIGIEEEDAQVDGDKKNERKESSSKVTVSVDARYGVRDVGGESKVR